MHKRLVITLTIDDPEMLETSEGVHEDLIAGDFVGNPQAFISKAEIAVAVKIAAPKKNAKPATNRPR